MARFPKSLAAPLAGAVFSALAFTAATGPLAGAEYPPAPGSGSGSGSGGVEAGGPGVGLPRTDGLPRTGSNTASTVQLASVLVAAGAGVLVVQAARRRSAVKTEA